MFFHCKFKLIAAWTRKSYKCFVDATKKRQKTIEILLLLARMPEIHSSKSSNCLYFAGEGLRLLEMLESMQYNYLTMSFTHQFEWLEMNIEQNFLSITVPFHIRTKDILLISGVLKKNFVSQSHINCLICWFEACLTSSSVHANLHNRKQ